MAVLREPGQSGPTQRQTNLVHPDPATGAVGETFRPTFSRGRNFSITALLARTPCWNGVVVEQGANAGVFVYRAPVQHTIVNCGVSPNS